MFNFDLYLVDEIKWPRVSRDPPTLIQSQVTLKNKKCKIYVRHTQRVEINFICTEVSKTHTLTFPLHLKLFWGIPKPITPDSLPCPYLNKEEDSLLGSGQNEVLLFSHFYLRYKHIIKRTVSLIVLSLCPITPTLFSSPFPSVLPFQLSSSSPRQTCGRRGTDRLHTPVVVKWCHTNRRHNR